MAQFLITTTVAAGPTPLSATLKTCRQFHVIAANGLDGPTASPNTGQVRIGQSSVAGEQPVELNPGDERPFNNEEGCYDLSKFWLTVDNNGDGVVVIYH